MLEVIYKLKADTETIKRVQDASLDKSSNSGLKIENNLLFGSADWFAAIEKGEIKKHSIQGVISKVYISGHNDWPEFEIENIEGKSQWTREGIESAYIVGHKIELVYVEQKFKCPIAVLGPISKCVFQISIEV